MKRIQVPEEAFFEEAVCHEAFQKAMGFSDFYGKNWDAWIDCMFSIDSPDDGMSKITVSEGESLEIEILIIDGNEYHTTITWGSFCACVAAVNGRFSGCGSETRIIITEKGTTA